MFLIESGNGTKIITDPVDEETGYHPPKVTADSITISHHHHDHQEVSAVGGSPKVIDTIGKFNINNIFIEGISSYHDEVKGDKRGRNIIYKFSMNGLFLVHMGDFGQPITEDQIRELQGVDILMIPVGGKYTLDHDQAAEVVGILQPKIAIPMHYKTKDCLIKIEGVEPFLEKMAVVKHVGSTVQIASSLPNETEVWVMDYIQ